jgi:hypothetical protein
LLIKKGSRIAGVEHDRLLAHYDFDVNEHAKWFATKIVGPPRAAIITGLFGSGELCAELSRLAR